MDRRYRFAFRAGTVGCVGGWTRLILVGALLVAVATTVDVLRPRGSEARAAAPSAARVRYLVPDRALRVSTAAGLARALRTSRRRDIVLADGVYDRAHPFVDARGNRLYAEHLGGAVLKTGLVLGGNEGPGGELVRGLAFDVSIPSRTAVGGMLDVWGSARGARVLDTSFDGNRRVAAGLVVQQTDGFVAERIDVRRVTSYGVSVQPERPLAPGRTPLLQDITVSGVARRVPRSSNGTAEACIWLAGRTILERARLRDCAWSGLWTGATNVGSSVSDVDVDRTPVGVYVEHSTRHATFRRLLVGPRTRVGVNCEWADPARGRVPGSVDNTIRDSTIRSSWVGVYMDEGTTRTAVTGTRFVGQKGAAIDDYRGVGNRYSGNDYRRIDPGAAPLVTGHL